MKRKLSLLLVLMMMFTLVPMSAFAATNTTSNTTTTASDAEFTATLTIEAKSSIGAGEVIEVALLESGASFSRDMTNADGGSQWNLNTTSGVVGLEGEKIVEFIATASINANTTIALPIELKNAPAGEMKASVRGLGTTTITAQTVTYAIVTGSGTVTSRLLESKKTVVRGLSTGSRFELMETSNTSISSGTIYNFRLPKDVTWESTTKISGTTHQTSFTTQPNVGEFTIKDRDLYVRFNSGSAAIDRYVGTPVFTVGKEARLGDIDVSFVNMDAEAVTVAEYVDYGVKVSVDKVKEIIAGHNPENKDYTVRVTLDPAGKSFNTNRPIDFTLNAGGVKLKASSDKNTKAGSLSDIASDYDDEFEAFADIAGDKMEFDLYLQGDWDQVEAMELTVSGGGVDEQTVKLADVIAPAKVATKIGEKEVADVLIGLQDQEAPVVTITETKAGSLKEGYYAIDFPAARYDGIQFVASTQVKVVSGNIDVTRTRNDQYILLNVKSSSTKEPAVIELSGLKVTLDRTVPFGPADMRLAYVGDTSAYEKKDVDKIVNAPFLNVVTEVVDARKVKTVFTIGEVAYVAGGESKMLDAAPFINNGRTMLPIGTVAQVVGATVNYDPVTRTATFDNGTRVVSMNLESNTLIVNGSPIPMDAKPMIVNSRAFVPVVYVTQAFGIQNGVDVVYDAAAKTVTVFPNAQ